MPLESRQGLKFDGLTSYIQLPSMTMDAIEIECMISSDQLNSTCYLFDARGGVIAFYYYSRIEGISAPYNGLINTPKNEHLTIHSTFTAGKITDDITIFAGVSGIVSSRAKGEVYSITCFLAGEIVAQYPINEGTGTTLTDTSGNGNHGTIYGATWLQKRAVRALGAARTLSVPMKPKKNLIKPFTSSEWIKHDNFTVTGEYSATINATATNQFTELPVKVDPNKKYTMAIDMTSDRCTVVTADKSASLGAISQPGYNQKTFTPTTTTIWIRLYSSTTGVFTFKNLILVEGDTAPDFEPYELIPDLKTPAR